MFSESRVFFHQGIFPVAIDGRIDFQPQTPMYLRLIDNDLKLKSPCLTLLKMGEGLPSVRMRSFRINSIIDEDNVINEEPGMATLQFPFNEDTKKILANLGSAAIRLASRKGTLIDEQPLLTVKIDEGFKKGLLPYPNGYRVGGITVMYGELPNKLGVKLTAAQIVLRPFEQA